MRIIASMMVGDQKKKEKEHTMMTIVSATKPKKAKFEGKKSIKSRKKEQKY